MAQEPLRVASIGIGRWSDVLGSAIKRSDKITIVNCFTRSEEKRADFARRYECRAAASYEELLEDPQVEAVLVTTPNYAHAEAIEQAAAAGKHVWVEKPIAHTIEHAARIGAAVRKAGVTFPARRGPQLLPEGHGAGGQGAALHRRGRPAAARRWSPGRAAGGRGRGRRRAPAPARHRGRRRRPAPRRRQAA